MTKDAIDPEAFFSELSKSYTGPEYTEMDRYRDFRELFLGSDRGKRVLWQLMGFGHMFRSTAALAAHDTNRAFFHEGERNVALRIFNTVHVEPKAKPARANTKPPKE